MGKRPCLSHLLQRGVAKATRKIFTLDAYEADELAAHEKILGERRKVDNAMPSQERQTKFVEPEVRSAQSGGSGTRPRIGTEAEQRAVEALKGREK